MVVEFDLKAEKKDIKFSLSHGNFLQNNRAFRC